MIIIGWKGLSNYLGRHIRTLKRYHYHKLKIPFLKSAPGKGGKISITEKAVTLWWYQINELSILGPQSQYSFPNRPKKAKQN